MAETLVIRLRASDEAPASWLIVDASGARSGPVQSGPAGDALSLSQGRRVVLLLPATEVALAEPELPLRGGPKLAQAVPFALEEQLASDVEALHFAVGHRQGSAIGTPVAVLARPLLERWHEACEAGGIRVDAAYSDAAALPASPNACTLLLDEGVLFVRRPDSVPYALDAEPVAAALDLAFSAAHGAAEHVVFYATPADYERHREAIEGLRPRTATMQVKLLPEGPLPLLAAQAVSGPPAVNLLQGPFAPRSSMAAQLKAWRVPAVLAAAVALLFAATQALAIWQLSRAEKKLDAQIKEVFAAALPGQPLKDARAQMQGVLGSGGSGQGALLPAMSVLAQALVQSPKARIESLSYRGDALDLRIVAPDVEALDAIKQALNRGGVTAELQSATPRGDTFEGRLQLRLRQA